ncbi:hypothetical protein GcM3_198017 [Golovinomyces cichoracearum]|uniref:Uncharacterized protein n=1 Tax=Golovinomyces cichoracearum TaxID=62708 RepID=A0A420HEU5_9PEZI|nr:hypothetical protein GcM3_198017 [Golovinomyces cichoracearum]
MRGETEVDYSENVRASFYLLLVQLQDSRAVREKFNNTLEEHVPLPLLHSSDDLDKILVAAPVNLVTVVLIMKLKIKPQHIEMLNLNSKAVSKSLLDRHSGKPADPKICGKTSAWHRNQKDMETYQVNDHQSDTEGKCPAVRLDASDDEEINRLINKLLKKSTLE